MKSDVLKRRLLITFAVAFAGVICDARCEPTPAQPNTPNQEKIEPPAPDTPSKQRRQPDDWDDLDPDEQAAPF